MGNKVAQREMFEEPPVFGQRLISPRNDNQGRANSQQVQQQPRQNQQIPVYQQNRSLEQSKKQRHERVVQGLCYTAIGALFYTLYNRHQSKKEIEDQYLAIINNTQSESERLYLENETFLERETSQFTILQLGLLTLAIILILHVPKMIKDFAEKNHWTSWFAGQITTDEYERQKRNFTLQEVQKLQRDARYRQFERERDQWREAERRMNEQGEEENKSDEEKDDNLEELLQNDDDTNSLEREFEKIDRHNERVRQRLRPRDTNSDISVRSQTVNRTITAVFNPVQQPPKANVSARSSMGPPPTAQPQLNRRQSQRADRDSESQSSRRSSQKFN